MKKNKNVVLKTVKKSAEKALRRDANSTTCIGIFQPKAPSELERFKRIK